MLRRLKGILLLLLLSSPAAASEVDQVSCVALSSTRSSCSIQLKGKVEEGERLFLPRVQDADRLYFKERQLGLTGYILGHPYYAAFFPRIYSLQTLRGQESPLLRLEVEALASASPQIAIEPKVVRSDFPLRRVLRRFLVESALFLLTLYLAYLALRRPREPKDGWSYPAPEERWLRGGLVAFLLLQREWSLLGVPGAWPASLHHTAELVSLLVATWSLHGMLHRARFHDRFCIERGEERAPTHLPYRVAGIGLVAALGLLLWSPASGGKWAFSALGATLFFTLARALPATEWRRMYKRSSTAPLLFHHALLLFAAAMVLSPLVAHAGRSLTAFATSFAWITLAAVIYRDRAHARRLHLARDLVEECRQELSRHASAQRRLQAFCAFVEDEWSAARVSLISVNGEMGIVVASEGPDALRTPERAQPRRIGPFLRRVCREGHILYAPVAEELGHEFQEQGLKHSSLAVPFRQEEKIRAVLCVMAEEGERIPPGDALTLEFFAAELSLEVLSASAQYVAEERSERLLSLARQTDSIAVEHMDGWGYLHLPGDGESRLLLAAHLPLPPSLTRAPSPLLQLAYAHHAREVYALWRALATAYEFVPREQKAILWMVSPRDFQNAFLRELGPERAALLLAQALNKAAKQIAEKEAFLLLGGGGQRIVGSKVGVRADLRAPGGLDLDDAQREGLHHLLLAGEPGAPRWMGAAPRELNAPSFQCRAVGPEHLGGQEFFSLLSVAADKKELKRLEQKAQEAARDFLKKAA